MFGGFAAAFIVVLSAASAASAHDGDTGSTSDDTIAPEDETSDDTTVHAITFPVDAEHQFINDWHFARDGRLWQATAAGIEVCCEDGSEVQVPQPAERPTIITGLAEDEEGVVWIRARE